jgi:hypothetical protein
MDPTDPDPDPQHWLSLIVSHWNGQYLIDLTTGKPIILTPPNDQMATKNFKSTFYLILKV